jgi:hypothetical protein
MSTVKPLHKVLSVAIIEQFQGNIAWTPGNCMRYLTQDVLAEHYCICRETPVTLADWNIALSIAEDKLTQNISQRAAEMISSLHKAYEKGALDTGQFQQKRLAILFRFKNHPFTSTGT